MTATLSERIAQIELTVQMAQQATIGIQAIDQELQSLEERRRTLLSDRENLITAQQEAEQAERRLADIAALLDGSWPPVVTTPPAAEAHEEPVGQKAATEPDPPAGAQAPAEPLGLTKSKVQVLLDTVQAHPWLTSPDYAQLTKEKPADISSRLSRCYSDGRLIRELDEDGIYVYALPGTPKRDKPQSAATDLAPQPTQTDIDPAQVLADIQEHPGTTADQIAERLGVPKDEVARHVADFMQEGSVIADDSEPPLLLALTADESEVEGQEQAPATPDVPAAPEPVAPTPVLSTSPADLPAHLRPVPEGVKVDKSMKVIVCGQLREALQQNPRSIKSEGWLIGRTSKKMSSKELAATIRELVEEDVLFVENTKFYGLSQERAHAYA